MKKHWVAVRGASQEVVNKFELAPVPVHSLYLLKVEHMAGGKCAENLGQLVFGSATSCFLSLLTKTNDILCQFVVFH